MEYQSGYVITLANSIIGVSILAMPYCFKQCGVILSILLLLISSIISRLACHFLLKSAIIARRKTFEFLAFHIFGAVGKLTIEIGMIGFLLGTCIAFFVVMGDLGPEIVSEMTGVKSNGTMRNSILVALAAFCVLPLGLLKNVDSLNGVSKATIGFYCCLVLKIMAESLPHIFVGDWYSDVVLWRPAGLLQCLPIFSMALFCQTQLFEIYQALPNASLEKMNTLIRVAVNICTWVYICVGAFGYIAFYQKPFTGNILMTFEPSAMSDIMKIGFVLSLAFSFPLVIFPCRASLYSLLYKGPSYTSLHEGTSNYIPEGKFKLLTAIIVLVSLIIGIMIPNIELVLGLIGSTIGVMICVLFPVTCFICISPKNTNERILAQIMLCVGIVVMVLGTYANMYAFEEATIIKPVTDKINLKPDGNNQDSLNNVVHDILLNPKVEANLMEIPTTRVNLEMLDKVDGKADDNKVKEVRHEPPQPVEPAEVIQPQVSPEPAKENPNLETIKDHKPADSVNIKGDTKESHGAEEKLQPPNQINNEPKPQIEADNPQKERQEPVVEPVFPQDDNAAIKNNEHANQIDVNNSQDLKVKKQTDVKKNDIDIEAIKKEDIELKEQEKEKIDETKEQHKVLIDAIQKQNEVNQALVEEQKKLIEVIQKQQEIENSNDIDKVNEEKVKAVKQIENIARKAIESISGHDKVVNSAEKSEPKQANKVEEAINNQKANPAPLSYQLGLNLEKTIDGAELDEASKTKLLPLPIAYAQQNQINVATDAKDQKKDDTQDKSANNKEIKNVKTNLTQNNAEDIQAMRRDILSDNDNEQRLKREANAQEDIKLAENAFDPKVCDEISKTTSTEKPIIKMLCKLSDPAPLNVDLVDLNAQGVVDLQPQKRDLKSAVEV